MESQEKYWKEKWSLLFNMIKNNPEKNLVNSLSITAFIQFDELTSIQLKFFIKR